MAFTSQGDRFRAGNKSDDAPGPYLTHHSYNVEPSCAPFNSSNPRATAGASASAGQRVESGPAPGAYDPKLPKAYDSGLPRKQVPFGCGGQRSSDGPRDGEALPGPGQYHSGGRKAQVLPCRTMGLPQSERRAMLKSASAPSIPSGNTSHFYEEIGDGRLLRQGPRDARLYLSGAVGDTAGPGHYDGHSSTAHLPRALGGRWGTGPARVKERASEMPGPGHYTAPEVEKAPPVYSSFVSQSRTRSEPVKRKRKRKDETPGPGQYYSDPRAVASMRPPELQFFGSTVDRFKDERVAEGPGPGAYVPRQRVVLKSSFNGSERFPDRKAATMPGPGAYDPANDGKSAGPAGTLSLLGSTGRMAFGSHSTKRGFGGDGGLGPGPGAYDLDAGAEKEEESRKKQVTRPPLARTAPRVEPPNRDEDRPMPAPGAYNPVHPNELGAVMRVPPRGEGFLSSGTRASGGKAASCPGPGSYTVDPGCVTGGKRAGTFNRTAAEGAPESGRPRGLGFESQASRFPGQSKFSKAPGPGAYAPTQEWTKKNFNVLFGDI